MSTNGDSTRFERMVWPLALVVGGAGVGAGGIGFTTSQTKIPGDIVERMAKVEANGGNDRQALRDFIADAKAAIALNTSQFSTIQATISGALAEAKADRAAFLSRMAETEALLRSHARAIDELQRKVEQMEKKP